MLTLSFAVGNSRLDPGPVVHLLSFVFPPSSLHQPPPRIREDYCLVTCGETYPPRTTFASLPCRNPLPYQFYFFTRWGRTGTSGQGKLEGPFDTVEEASTLFEAKFEEKTGNDWDVDDHEDRYVVNEGKGLFFYCDFVVVLVVVL